MKDVNLLSWGLFAISCAGLWLQGINPKWGWRFAIANQIGAWLPYNIITHQFGLGAMSLVFTIIYARNLRRWKGTEIATPGKVCTCDA